jgi:hypothetical protein
MEEFYVILLLLLVCCVDFVKKETNKPIICGILNTRMAISS